MWQAVWSHRAAVEIDSLTPQVRDRIMDAVDRFARTGHGDVKALKGPGRLLRLRVGDWRVIFTSDTSHQTLYIASLHSRATAYR